jgi:amino acid adenylation domain-containing protein
LRSRGVGADLLVGLFLERSIDLLVGILAVLKAGGAYLPLDPAYPPRRVALMLEDACVPWLITHAALAAALGDQILPAIQGRPAVICLDADWQAIERAEHHQTPAVIHPLSLAYVIYTSGSTGAPKGAMLEQRGMLNHLWAIIDELDLRASDIVAQTASHCFDISVWQLLAALLVGGKIHIVTNELTRDPLQLLAQIEAQAVTVAQLVPSVLQAMVEEATWRASARPALRALRWMIPTGEALPPQLGRAWFGRYPDIPLLNAYGPAECSDDVTFYRLLQAPSQDTVYIPIGRPTLNTRIYLLSGAMQPVPIGVTGEIYVGGVGVGRGYLYDPQRTAGCFVPNPFGPERGGRLYRTGDLARYLADGNIEFLGRNDHQIKLRGFRIELGEVEAALSQHPAIAEALVTVCKSEASNDYLVAYVVGEPDHELGTEQLRSWLEQRLPGYMIPAVFIQLDLFPVTPNGKIDRQALPTPDLSTRSLRNSFVPPRDPIELQLAEIWEQLLGVAPVGALDNFFDLGGHSLLAVHLMTKIQGRFGKHLPLAVLFQGATVANLAAVLRSGSSASMWSPLVPMQTRGDNPALFCVPGAGGNVIGFYEFVRQIGTVRPIYGLQARGIDGEAAPHTHVEEMAAYYIEAIRHVQPEGPYFLCGHSFGSWVAFEIAQQLQRQGQQIALLAILNTSPPLATSPDPAFQAAPDAERPDDTAMLLSAARSIERAFGKHLGLSREQLLPLSTEEQITYLTEQLKSVDILPAEAETKYVRGFVNVFKTNYMTTYTPADCLPTRIVLFRANERHAEDDEKPLSIRDDPAWGWGAFAAGPVEVHWVPGEHLTMLQEPHVHRLAEILRSYLL